MTLEERIARNAWGPERGPGLALLRAALIPAGWLYGAGWRIRSALPAAPARLPARVISVGNVTVGGTGKTPIAARVAEILARSGARVAILSRGYGRASREDVVIAGDGEHVLADAARAGDEPVWLARKLPGVPVIVGADRARTGRLAVEKFGAGALVLDDAFQNRALAKDLEIVAVDGRRPFGNGRLLPAGPLRMPAREIARAGVVILTKLGPEDDPEPVRRAIAALAPGARVFEATTAAVEFRDVATGKSVPLDFMRRRRVAAMCGIAEPLAFARVLDEEGFEVVGTYPFPDHHAYTAEDIARVRREAHAIEAVIVTEKDEVKIMPEWARGTPPVLSLVTAMRLDDEPSFERIVLGNE